MGVIKEIIEAEPTDGLWKKETTDEEQLGAKYSELEWAMCYRSQEDNNTGNLSVKEKNILSIYDKHNKNNQHKMTPIPICKIPKKIKT